VHVARADFKNEICVYATKFLFDKIRPMPLFVSKRKTGDLSHSHSLFRKFDCFFAFNLRPGFPCQTRNENSQKRKGFD